MAAYGRKWARGQVRRPSSFSGRAGECACVWRGALQTAARKGRGAGVRFFCLDKQTFLFLKTNRMAANGSDHRAFFQMFDMLKHIEDCISKSVVIKLLSLVKRRGGCFSK